MPEKMWMVRAETGGRLFETFKSNSIVAIGWHQIGPLDDLTGRDAIVDKVQRCWPDWHKMKIRMNGGQLHRFRNEMVVGERIVTYDPSSRVYLVGTLSGEYRWDSSHDAEFSNVRPVEWEGEVSRDWLSVPTKNSLGAISTLFLVPEEAGEELEHFLS